MLRVGPSDVEVPVFAFARVAFGGNFGISHTSRSGLRRYSQREGVGYENMHGHLMTEKLLYEPIYYIPELGWKYPCQYNIHNPEPDRSQRSTY